MLGRRQVVRHRFLVPAFAGSNPAAPAIDSTKDSIAFPNGPVRADAAQLESREIGAFVEVVEAPFNAGCPASFQTGFKKSLTCVIEMELVAIILVAVDRDHAGGSTTHGLGQRGLQ